VQPIALHQRFRQRDAPRARPHLRISHRELRAHMAFRSRASSTAMMNQLFGQFYTSRLPATLRYRSDVRIAHKTGDYPPTSGSDVGVIEYPGGPLFVSVFTNANRGDFAQLELTIGKIAELLGDRNSNRGQSTIRRDRAKSPTA
jgi:hypothetical protein